MAALLGVLIYIFGIIAVLGIPVATIVCCIVFLVKAKKCSPEETERKKLLKTCGIIFGIIGGAYVVSVIAVTLLLSASIAYM